MPAILTAVTLAAYLREAESVHAARQMPASDWPQFYAAFLSQRMSGADTDSSAEFAVFSVGPEQALPTESALDAYLRGQSAFFCGLGEPQNPFTVPALHLAYDNGYADCCESFA